MQLQARKLNIDGLSLHRINLGSETVEINPIPTDDSHFYQYVRSLINDVSLGEVGRTFKVRDMGTQVIGSIIKIVTSNDFKDTDGTAMRLLFEEIKVQKKIAQLGKEMQEGVLIQALVIDNETKKFIICKAENLDFIDKTSYDLKSGFPLRRRIYRSVQIKFDKDDKIASILVNDQNTKGATYWWDSFLELDQQWDDIYNTKKAFNIIDSKILMPLKKDFPSDHMFLRNASIKYFRTAGEFELDDYLEKCFNGYEPVNSQLDVDAMKEKIKLLPEKFSFDKKFDLKPVEIRAKIKSIVKLTSDVDLVIKQDIDIERYITSEIEDNKKYIKIRTDEGYEFFKK